MSIENGLHYGGVRAAENLFKQRAHLALHQPRKDLTEAFEEPLKGDRDKSVKQGDFQAVSRVSAAVKDQGDILLFILCS